MSEAKARDKVTYLSFVQANIARMSNYACALKGACCAIVVSLIAIIQQLSDPEPKWRCYAVVVAVCALFGAFDAKYLCIERSNRALYKLIDENEDGTYQTSLELPIRCKEDGSRWVDAVRSWSVWPFYVALAAIGIVTCMMVI